VLVVMLMLMGREGCCCDGALEDLDRKRDVSMPKSQGSSPLKVFYPIAVVGSGREVQRDITGIFFFIECRCISYDVTHQLPHTPSLSRLISHSRRVLEAIRLPPLRGEGQLRAEKSRLSVSLTFIRRIEVRNSV
jgi:hypothetical protein